ncbi:putative flavoprotein [Phascolomyces articulosus]|uniref:Flavoprotein n=1 Tax=Phascolomyces articulosus TaxID=60185 RepID=A0AAD5K1A8_9FUNG|nr:putative flavoprotein [Phascolomyces articulosus]
MSSNRKNTPPTVAIIGTGFSGICAAIQLEKQLGAKVRLFEISKDLGGTWNVNRYPGAACDVPSHLYSFSFEQNPSWTERYSSQEEIHKYLQGVARKYHVYEKTTFETEVIRADWLETKQQWQVRWRNVNDHEVVGEDIFDYVLSGVGGLRIPNVPEEYTGFSGPIVHTTYWDSSIDYTNKRIAIIGSGATAIQVIPEIRKVATHVYSYQRTPAWVNPRIQYSYSSIIKFMFRWIPFVMRFYRYYLYWLHESRFPFFGYHKKFGGLVRKKFVESMEGRLKSAGRPDLIPLLVPDYPPGCKRICQSEFYLEAMAQKNVSVIRTGIDEIRCRTLVDKEGNEIEVDVLILATGFNVEDILGNLEVYGRNGQGLTEYFEKNKITAYKTVAIHGFPNFFTLLGQGSGLGHNSIIQIIEAQTEYVIKCIKGMKKKNLAAIEPKQSAQEKYFSNVQKGFDGTVWKSGCKSWYRSNDTGEIYTLWNGSVTSFWMSLRKPAFRDFIQYKQVKPN